MTKKRRIAFVCHPYHRGGVTRWMAEAANGAAESGNDTYFVTVTPSKEFVNSGGRETMMQLVQSGHTKVQLITQKVDFTFEFGTPEYRASVYRKLIMAGVPEGTPIIVSDDEAAWASAASLADKYPMIGVLHGDQDYYYDRAKEFYQQMSVCACVSGRINRTLKAKIKGINSNMVCTIPCGIKLPEFTSREKNDVLQLIFIGRLSDYEKRAYDLVKIGDALNRLGVRFHLHIVGNSEKSKVAFSEDFEKSGIGKCVTFHGWQGAEQVQQLLHHSDILLLTSNSEGMPLVMMEALAAGCGFTGTRVSGIEDYENDPSAGNCVSIYTVGDIDDAVNKIKALANVPLNIREAEARKLAEIEFSMEVCLNKYFEAIDALPESRIVAKPLKVTGMSVLYSQLIATARYMKLKIRS